MNLFSLRNLLHLLSGNFVNQVNQGVACWDGSFKSAGWEKLRWCEMRSVAQPPQNKSRIDWLIDWSLLIRTSVQTHHSTEWTQAQAEGSLDPTQEFYSKEEYPPGLRLLFLSSHHSPFTVQWLHESVHSFICSLLTHLSSDIHCSGIKLLSLKHIRPGSVLITDRRPLTVKHLLPIRLVLDVLTPVAHVTQLLVLRTQFNERVRSDDERVRSDVQRCAAANTLQTCCWMTRATR